MTECDWLLLAVRSKVNVERLIPSDEVILAAQQKNAHACEMSMIELKEPEATTVALSFSEPYTITDKWRRFPSLGLTSYKFPESHTAWRTGNNSLADVKCSWIYASRVAICASTSLPTMAT